MIRKARPTDYTFVAKLMIQAMEDIASKFINQEDPYQATELFEHFFQQENNQYSYQHTLVYLENEHDDVIGSLTAYDGARLIEYRQPILDYIVQHYGHVIMFDPESGPGEFYFDTLSVHANYQGKGIGKKLIQAGIDWARTLGHQRVGLLVDEHNPSAKKLYHKMGFYTLEKKHFAGGIYDHLVFDIY